MCSAFDYDTENMNSEDIYSSLKGVTEAIQNFSVRSQEDMNEPVQRREGEEVGMTVLRLSMFLLFIYQPFLRPLSIFFKDSPVFIGSNYTALNVILTTQDLH